MISKNVTLKRNNKDMKDGSGSHHSVELTKEKNTEKTDSFNICCQ